MPDSRLVIPHDVEGVLVDVLKRRHVEHLAKVERARGLTAQTFQPFVTVARMSDSAGLRLSGDTVPAILLGVIGVPTFQRNELDGLDAVFQLGVQVTVMGQRRKDTLFRRDVMAWTAAECLIQRAPRSSEGLVSSVRLTDYEPLAEAETQRTVGDARMVFEVGCNNVMSITGGLPADDSTWPASAGGAPVSPYDPVPAFPPATTGFTVDRQPLVE